MNCGYRLAWPHFNGEFRASRFAYVSQAAATRAAPIVSVSRIARGLEPVTHVAQFDGEQLVAFAPLPGANEVLS